jgi:hypothetical protein
MFVSGNRVLAPLKLLDVEEAVKVIGSNRIFGTNQPKVIQTPEPEEMYNISEEKDDFIKLKEVDNNVPLKDRSNHMLVKLRVLEVTGSCQSIEASELETDPDHPVTPSLDKEDTKAYVDTMKVEQETLLAYLWYVTTSKGCIVPVNNVRDASEALDQFCCCIREKLSTPHVNLEDKEDLDKEGMT